MFDPHGFFLGSAAVGIPAAIVFLVAGHPAAAVTILAVVGISLFFDR